jgi:exodeoxyribonuclease VII small subunit
MVLKNKYDDCERKEMSLPNPSVQMDLTAPVDQLSYEDAFQQLENIVARLESEGLSLDAMLTLYERGQALISHCATLLDQAELRIKQLSGDHLTNYTPTP